MTLAWVRLLPAAFTPAAKREADSQPWMATSSNVYLGSYLFISVM